MIQRVKLSLKDRRSDQSELRSHSLIFHSHFKKTVLQTRPPTHVLLSRDPILNKFDGTANTLWSNTKLTAVLKLQGTESRHRIVNDSEKANDNRTNL